MAPQRQNQAWTLKRSDSLLGGIDMVGLAGFEPAASSSRTKRSTKLSHSPLNLFRVIAGGGSVYIAYFARSGKKEYAKTEATSLSNLKLRRLPLDARWNFCDIL